MPEVKETGEVITIRGKEFPSSEEKTMYKVLGGCHCGNISYVAEMSNELSSYKPRACDCKLCSSHGASYASDSKGSLTIKIKNKAEVSKYRQGSRIADFLICKNCGVMTNVIYEEEGCIFGSINTRSANEFEKFADAHIAHLTQLDDKERIKRWKEIWFSNVKVEHEGA